MAPILSKFSSSSQNIHGMTHMRNPSIVASTVTASFALQQANYNYNYYNNNNNSNNNSKDDYDDDDEFEPDSETTYTNPFMPSLIKQRMSMQRRPWAHLYPLRSDGSPIFPNQVKVVNNLNNYDPNMLTEIGDRNMSVSNTLTVDVTVHSGGLNTMGKMSPDSNNFNLMNQHRIATNHVLMQRDKNNMEITNSLMRKKHGVINMPMSIKGSNAQKPNWEFSNIDETMGIVKTGVAWKSLTTPACLPLTTDFFPSAETWNTKFACSSDYSLLLEDIRDQYGFTNYQYNNKITMAQVFNELVGHRLAMGFQIVVPKNTFTYAAVNTPVASSNASSAQSKGTIILSTTPTSSSNMPSNMSTAHSVTISNALTANFISDLSSSLSVIARREFNSIRGYFKVYLIDLSSFFFCFSFNANI